MVYQQMRGGESGGDGRREEEDWRRD